MFIEEQHFLRLFPDIQAIGDIHFGFLHSYGKEVISRQDFAF